MAWSRVQSKTAFYDPGASSISATFDSNVTSGNTIIVATSAYGYDINTVSDGLSNSYNTIATLKDTTNDTPGGLYYANNITGGACTVTVNFTGTNYYQRLIIVEYAEVADTTPLDVQAEVVDTSMSTTTDSASSGATPSTTGGNKLVFGFIAPSQAGSISAGTGFTQIAVVEGCLAEEKTGSGNTTYEATGTADQSTRGLAFVAVFDSNAGGGSTTYTVTPAGGIAFAGAPGVIKTKNLVPSGGVTFAGSVSQLRTRTLSPSGGIAFAGDVAQIKTRVSVPDGGIAFGGGSPITGPGGIASRLLSLIGVGR